MRERRARISHTSQSVETGCWAEPSAGLEAVIVRRNLSWKENPSGLVIIKPETSPQKTHIDSQERESVSEKAQGSLKKNKNI